MNFIANPDPDADKGAAEDPDADKGAVEPSRPEDNKDGNVASFNEQLDHRFQDPLNKSSDSGLPGSGQTAEYSMEHQEENELNKDMDDHSARNDKDADAAKTQHKNQG
jgi:hypothetical protein